MKQITIKLNDGTEITAQVDEDEFAKFNKAVTLSQNTLCASAMALTSRARTGYERVKLGENYYTSAHELYYSPREEEQGSNSGCSDELFKRGNYVNDEQLFDDRDRARVLHDRLEQWQALNDEPVDWSNLKEKNVWYIEYDYTAQSIIACYTLSVRPVGTLGFSTHAKAQEAIDVFRDELMWYFTEYRSRLDEPIHSNKT